MARELELTKPPPPFCLVSLHQAAIRDPNPVVFLENELMYGISFPMSEAAMKDDVSACGITYSLGLTFRG